MIFTDDPELPCHLSVLAAAAANGDASVELEAGDSFGGCGAGTGLVGTLLGSTGGCGTEGAEGGGI